MEQQIHITLRYNLAIGNVNLNEIVYRLKELRDPLMLSILEQILREYDDLIVQRLSRTDIYGSRKRKGLGRHVRKGDRQGHDQISEHILILSDAITIAPKPS